MFKCKWLKRSHNLFIFFIEHIIKSVSMATIFNWQILLCWYYQTYFPWVRQIVRNPDVTLLCGKKDIFGLGFISSNNLAIVCLYGGLLWRVCICHHTLSCIQRPDEDWYYTDTSGLQMDDTARLISHKESRWHSISYLQETKWVKSLKSIWAAFWIFKQFVYGFQFLVVLVLIL